jgi:hypothetical protein
MVQPKYSPEEALQRVKLMMGYDMSKTLDENKKIIEEQSTASVLKSVAGGAATGAAVGGISSAGFFAIPGAVVGGILGLVSGLSGGDVSRGKIKQLFQSCSTNKKELGKKTMDDATLDKLSDDLNAAVNKKYLGFIPGTDEEKIKSVFSKIQSIPDLCALVDNYKNSYGDLSSDLDGDLENDREWRDYVFLPLRPALRKSQNASQDSGGGGKKIGGGGTGGGTSYKPCTGTYQYGCKSDVIAKVQGCLKLSADGKFGPKTKAALTAKGFTTFTDADVDKICSGTEEKLGSDVESQTLGQDQNAQNTNTGSNTNPQDSTTKTGIS